MTINDYKYAFSKQGTFLVEQTIRCTKCDMKGKAFVNMSIVINDELPYDSCIVCGEYNCLVITTYLEGN